MRRAHLRVLPAFAHWFGIRPWEFELLTFDEIEEFMKKIPKRGPDG